MNKVIKINLISYLVILIISVMNAMINIGGSKDINLDNQDLINQLIYILGILTSGLVFYFFVRKAKNGNNIIAAILFLWLISTIKYFYEVSVNLIQSPSFLVILDFISNINFSLIICLLVYKSLKVKLKNPKVV